MRNPYGIGLETFQRFYTDQLCSAPVGVRPFPLLIRQSTLEEDQIELADDRISATGSVFTDGCSSISVALCREVWKALRASQRIPRSPSAYQFRCGGAKGVLVKNPNLPGKTLVFRPSQTKFEAADIRTLDIAATSSKPILAYLNRPLIALLEYHGTLPEAFMALQKLAIEEGQSINDSLLQASKIFSQHGLGASFRLPSLFNNLYYQLKFEIGDWSKPHLFQHFCLKTALAYATTHILREIKHRAHIIIPGSYTLIGVSDEWDCLEDGEVYATVVDERAGLNLPITGRILITRKPPDTPRRCPVRYSCSQAAVGASAERGRFFLQVRFSISFFCILHLEMVEAREALASKLGGGDLDGDIYNIILNENLFPPKDFTAVPGEYVALPPKETALPCRLSDVADFVIDFIKSDLVGYISILHLRIGDLDPEGPGCAGCLKLAEYASHAVDFCKKGVPVNFKDLPKPSNQRKPDYLSGEGVNPTSLMGDAYYPSLKILGKLYRSVPDEDYHPDPSELEQQRTDGRKIQTALASAGLHVLGLPSLDTPPDEDLLEEMRNILDEYSDQLMVIAKTHTTSKRANAYLSEAELVSGTIQERYSDHRKRREAVSAMNLQTGELAKAIRHEFQSPDYREMQDVTAEEEDQDGDESDDWEDMAQDEERRRDKFERAWAAWLVAEEALDDDPSSYEIHKLESGPLMARRVKVAVVGSGLAGLSAAYLLASSHRDNDVEYEVHLFEKTATLGMDSSSVSIGNEDQQWRIDVPMRSFQGGYYPRLIALYTQLGVAFRQKDFSYSFSLFSHSEKTQHLRTTMIYNGASGRDGVGMPAWLQDLHLYQKGSRVVTRAFALGLFILSTIQLFRHNELIFEEWAAETVPRNFIWRILRFDTTWRSFTQDVLIPLFSAVCTAPKEIVNAHPVEDFLDYVWLTFGTHHYVVTKGVRDAVSRLTFNVKHIHLSSRIVGIHADPNDPRVASIECATKTGTATHHGFHHIVFATQANRVGPLLSSYAASLPPESQARHAVMAQINCLDEFHYIRTIVINHTDDSSDLIPPDQRDRRDLNLVTAASSTPDASSPWSPHRVSPAYTMTTQILVPPPALKDELAAPVFQTTNPFVTVHDDRILSVATLERAVLTMHAKDALRGLCRETRRAWWQSSAEAEYRLGDLQGAGRRESDARPGIWLCGSYAHVGIPLLEGCVVSARNVYLGICESEGIRPASASHF
ncbi:hypothetical protein MVEN_01931600 [Mycena venus]|uniref:RNA-dependent RNA polymerase n=1 Tax=Mycena venus TaxID=2733690 RepID=A0A8H6XGK8_9AGAR|nr:hypothetical protein MVEN_01931600 [Mycena venus]